MKQRLSALLLTLILLLSSTAAYATEDGASSSDLLIAPVSAAESVTPSMGHFVPRQLYDGRFTDVRESDWFYSYVETLYQLGLTRGQEDTFFGTEAPISIKEVLCFAARIRSLYALGDAEAGAAAFVTADLAAADWHLPYLSYLRSLGLVDSSFDSLLDTNATRAQAAHIMTLALPAEEFSEINTTTVTVGYATHSFITDVDDYTPYQQDILSLYKWGVLTGSDETGTFFPSDAIKRSEFAALLTRLVSPALRVKLSWDVSAYYTARSKAYSDLVTRAAFQRTHAVDDLTAIDNNLRYMLSSGSNTIILQLDKATVTEAMVTTLLSNYLQSIRHYIEQSYNAVSCSYSASTGRVTLRFYSSIFSDNLFPSARSKALEMAVLVHDQLWENGTITPGMTEREKALAYYTWICENCVYDFRATETSVSHTAYSLFSMGTAVCDGYTAAYNLLLKLEGISCTTATTDDHIWTVATLDGQQLHIDPTWGDETGSIRYEFFGMTEAEAFARF